MDVIFLFKNIRAYNFACTDSKTDCSRSCKGTSWMAWGFAEHQCQLFFTVYIPTSCKPCLSHEQCIFIFSCHPDLEPVLSVSAVLLNSRNKHWCKIFSYRTSRSISFMTHPAGVLQMNDIHLNTFHPSNKFLQATINIRDHTTFLVWCRLWRLYSDHMSTSWDIIFQSSGTVIICTDDTCCG
jgi:hypothetical protein